MDYYTIAAGIGVFIVTISLSTYKIGRWVDNTSRQLVEMKELYGFMSQRINKIDNDLNNHIKHYDYNLSEINKKLSDMKNEGVKYGKNQKD